MFFLFEFLELLFISLLRGFLLDFDFTVFNLTSLLRFFAFFRNYVIGALVLLNLTFKGDFLSIRTL